MQLLVKQNKNKTDICIVAHRLEFFLLITVSGPVLFCNRVVAVLARTGIRPRYNHSTTYVTAAALRP